jgi:lysyl-tRNA synthetase class 2
MTRHADFRPTADWPMLRLRAELLRKTRDFFDRRGFIEVETPILSSDVVVDRHLDPFSAVLSDDPRRPEVGRRLWLQTSPEFHMKRLLASGGGAIYQITRAFRNGERGARHNPEFTIVEWYRRGDDYAAGMRLLSELCQSLLGRGPASTITYAEALARYAHVDPHGDSIATLAAAAKGANIAVPESMQADDRDAWLDLLLVECVEPNLGKSEPQILHDYPPSQAALAVVRNEEPPVAERFELYVDGLELANGYHELLDAQVLRQRNRQNNALRQQDGKPALPEESRLLAAMEAGLPACTGVALGLDRVVMLVSGAAAIDRVIAFPIERA